MVGVWAVAAWMRLGRPRRLRIVELGPGRGTLMADLLRSTAPFRDFAAALSVHLVDVSPALCKVQWGALRCAEGPGEREGAGEAGTEGAVRRGRSTWSQIPVSWYPSLDDVPGGVPALYILHEFVDALPVHQVSVVGIDMLT